MASAGTQFVRVPGKLSLVPSEKQPHHMAIVGAHSGGQ